MKLSDAIALGRTLVAPTAGGPCADRAAAKGCALQMALVAVGEEEAAYRYHGPDYSVAEELFGRDIIRVAFPEFDRRFSSGDTNLDAFIDWVRSFEPAEPPAEVEHPQTREAELERVAIEHWDSRAGTR